MPTYEFRCPNGHVFELFQRMSDPLPEVCQECGAAPLERVLYPVAVHFKGSGFYATDYGKGSRKTKQEGAATDSGSGGDGGETKPPEKKAAEA